MCNIVLLERMILKEYPYFSIQTLNRTGLEGYALHINNR